MVQKPSWSDSVMLGKEIAYSNNYNREFLTPVARSIGRDTLNISANYKFNGWDFWNCYEFSWLNQKGKPEIRILEFIVAADSAFIIESKSLKLYLNSFHGTKFASEEEVIALLKQDLSAIVQTKIELKVWRLEQYQKSLKLMPGKSLDELDVHITDYQVNSNLLQLSQFGHYVEETLCSNLLKSNCLITKQPDWAAIMIKYSGKQIDHHSLLKYLISFREHNEFHEQCVEHIFTDIMQNCQPDSLTILAKYTRRGGIDINPMRTSEILQEKDKIFDRDLRQ